MAWTWQGSYGGTHIKGGTATGGTGLEGSAGSLFANHAKPLRKTANYNENLFTRTMDGNPLIDKAYQLLKTDLFELWKHLKRGLKDNTFQNYCYMLCVKQWKK